jgi:GNAT superfamily N-acetyltransferase
MDEDGGEAVEVLRVSEAEIGDALNDQLKSLLQSSFPGYPDRDYYKLPPHFRFIAIMGGDVVAQMGVELRVVRAGQRIFRTFGVVDFCVKQSSRSRRLATRLLNEVTEYAGSCAMDFILLFADDDRLYVRNGWHRATNPCSWVRINEHRTLGLAHGEVTNALMVKSVQGKAWPDGEVDLLGHLF